MKWELLAISSYFLKLSISKDLALKI